MNIMIGGYEFSFWTSHRLFPDEMYANYTRLGYEKDKDFSEAIPLLIKPTGETAFLLHESVPTFDAGDREYDGWHELYLTRRRGKWMGTFVGSGYRVGRVELYGYIHGADRVSKELLKRFETILASR